MSILQELTSSTYDTSELKAIQRFLLSEGKTLSDITLKTWLGTGENQIAKRAAALLDDDLEALYAYYKGKPRPKDTVGEMRYAAIMAQYKKRHHITEAQDGELSVGDTVEVSGNVQFQDCVGEVESLHGGFVAVKIYSSNSTHSFHASDLRKIDDDRDHGDDGDEDEDDSSDESFFVVIHDSDENKSFIGEFEKDGGRWREHVVSGKPPYAWGGRFMSYLKDHEIMSMLRKDFKHYVVDGPFDSKEEAVEFVHGNHGHDTLKESEELKALGRNIKKSKKPADDELPPEDDTADETPPEDGDTPPADDEAPSDEPAPDADTPPEDGDVPPADDAAPTDEPPADEEPETTTADTDTVSADAVTPEFKVGDIVKPNKGQHAGEPHEVVGIHPDGGLLIKPQGLDDTAIKYTAKSKTAKIRTDDVQIVESQMMKRGLLRTVTETRLDNGALTMPELLKLRNGLHEAGDLVGYRILVQAITEAKAGAKPNMRGVEAKLAAHAKSKVDREAKYGTLSPGDQVSHENVRKRLLKDLSRERSKANCTEGKVGDFVAKVKRGAEATQKARGEAAKIWGSKDEDEAKKHARNSNRYSNLGTERSGKSDYVPPKSALSKLAGAVMGHPSGAPKYKVGDTVSYEMSPGQEKGRGTSKIVKLGKDYHYALENGAYVNQTEIKKVVKEGIMDLFKGKKEAAKIEKPARFPSSSNVAEWMRSTVDYWKAKQPKDLWFLFSPTMGDYLPATVHSGASQEAFKKHLAVYKQLKKENPEAVAEAKKRYRENLAGYKDGPREDYLEEGIMDLFKGKKDEPKAKGKGKGKGMHSREITVEERDMISKFFPNNNSNLKDLSDRKKFLFPGNVHADFGIAKINFYIKDDVLMAGIAWHSDSRDTGNPSKRPLFHTDEKIESVSDMQKLKRAIDGTSDEGRKSVRESTDKKLFRIDCTDDKGAKRSMLLHAADEVASRTHCAKKGYTVRKVKDVTGEEAPPTRKVHEGQLDEVSNALLNRAHNKSLDRSNAVQKALDRDNDNKYGDNRRPITKGERAELDKMSGVRDRIAKRQAKTNFGPSEEEKHYEYNRKRATGFAQPPYKK